MKLSKSPDASASAREMRSMTFAYGKNCQDSLHSRNGGGLRPHRGWLAINRIASRTISPARAIQPVASTPAYQSRGSEPPPDQLPSAG
jgi:hypothetical protein